ncbi:hypothetical protein [Haloechinothrix sp. LS1_15]|uniref:hypothetical protein n=1 Tax=Haloechinothrix sp. LS1_15 TaxID=2652248 RepID=UPI0029441E16|nr:hypothetical protein [Haloechinothrix sp. LS1_15]MDV6012315.1 hypothetical protein [Haloechinothrix sp. LS1_15]
MTSYTSQSGQRTHDEVTPVHFSHPPAAEQPNRDECARQPSEIPNARSPQFVAPGARTQR